MPDPIKQIPIIAESSYNEHEHEMHKQMKEITASMPKGAIRAATFALIVFMVRKTTPNTIATMTTSLFCRILLKSLQVFCATSPLNCFSDDALGGDFGFSRKKNAQIIIIIEKLMNCHIAALKNLSGISFSGFPSAGMKNKGNANPVAVPIGLDNDVIAVAIGL
jgi:hypothetical protein